MNNYCFCGLALGIKYRLCAIDLAKDLQKYHPGVEYLILTDDTSDFRDLKNVIAIKHSQDSIMFPYNDRRFAIEKALFRYDRTIQIDTDIRLLKPLIFPNELDNLDGIIAKSLPLKNHLNQYQPQNLPYYEKIAQKLDIDFDSVSYVGEFVFAVARNMGKEREFVHYWGMIAKYLELQRIHGADGPIIGLAAAKVGLPIYSSEWPNKIENEYVDHLKFSSGKQKIQKTELEKFKFRLVYHYRLNKQRLIAFKNFSFYYLD
jgi:hypothetical protein